MTDTYRPGSASFSNRDTTGHRRGTPAYRDDETVLDPDEMAETYWHLVEQDDVSTQPFEVHTTNGPQNSGVHLDEPPASHETTDSITAVRYW